MCVSCSEETHQAGLDDERGVEEHVWISGTTPCPDRHGNHDASIYEVCVSNSEMTGSTTHHDGLYTTTQNYEKLLLESARRENICLFHFVDKKKSKYFQEYFDRSKT